MSKDINEELKSLISRKFLKVIPSAQFQHVVMHLGMRDETAAVVVGASGQLLGIFAESDIAKTLVDRVPRKAPISQIMKKRIYSVDISESLIDHAEIMMEQNLSILPVTECNIVIGVLKRKDVIKVLFSAYNKKNKQSHDLQKQLEFKEDYLSIVSRDIQTPLHVITLSCDYLLSHKDQLTEEQLGFLDRILRNSDNAMNVIANVLKHARVESGFTLQIEPTQIDSLLTEASSALQAIAASSLCRLSIRCDRSFEIDIDRMRMLHVLQNLVANITHFAKEGSTICLDVSIVEINEKDSLRIRVYEKFINSSKVIEEIEFFQNKLDEDQDIVRTFGLGIGLAVVRKFVQLHNGDMNIQMGEDKNSFVEVIIPGVKLVCDLKREDPNKVKILLVEDDDDIREYFKEEFELAGMEVICARNGEEGANCFYRYRPDIVFSDIRMPVRDGFELLAEVRSDDPSCPFVFCSGYYPNLYNELEKSDYKADLFINKPVSGQKLLECIGPLVNRVKMAA